MGIPLQPDSVEQYSDHRLQVALGRALDDTQAVDPEEHNVNMAAIMRDEMD